MSPKSFSVRIFLQDGHADGVKILSRSKWSGRGLVIPRASFANEKNRQELKAPGVYVLIGSTSGSNQSTIYIGHADQVYRDLEDHYSHKDFWSWSVIFTSKDESLSLTQFQYLASRLLQLAGENGSANLDNLKIPPILSLTREDEADAELFLDYMLGIYPLLGLSVFE